MTGADTVIVGAGSSGCVLAARLAAAGTGSVLLIEAGPAETATRRTWGGWATTGRASDRVPLVRGRMLGGTSRLQGGVYLHGYREDHLDWGAAVSGWDTHLVPDAIRNLENDLDRPDAWHGHRGPISITRPTTGDREPVHTRFVDAMTSFGYPWCEDLNGPGAWGVGQVPLSSLASRSTADSHLARVLSRANIRVLGNTTATRLILTHGRVRGVAIRTAGKTSEVEAREVIVCAGAIGSPLLLQQSGIGDTGVLRAAGIDSIVDIPAVGSFLRDHPTVWIELDVDGLSPEPRQPLFQVMARSDRGQPNANSIEAFRDVRAFGPARALRHDADVASAGRHGDRTSDRRRSVEGRGASGPRPPSRHRCND